MKAIIVAVLLISLSGCTRILSGLPGNPLPSYSQRYDPGSVSLLQERREINLRAYGDQRNRPSQKLTDVNFALTLSGGGHRAAAVAAGVLAELDDMWSDGRTLLDEVDYLSSNSGGGWTAGVYIAERISANRQGYRFEFGKAGSNRLLSKLREIRISMFSNCLNSLVEKALNSSSPTMGDIFVPAGEVPNVPYLFASAATYDDYALYIFDKTYHDWHRINRYEYCGREGKELNSFFESRLSTAITASSSVQGTRVTTGITDFCRGRESATDLCAVEKKSNIIQLADGGIVDNAAMYAAYSALRQSMGAKSLMLMVNSSADTPTPVRKKEVSAYKIGTGAASNAGAGAQSLMRRALMDELDRDSNFSVVSLNFEVIALPDYNIGDLVKGLENIEKDYRNYGNEKRQESFREYLYGETKKFKASYKTTAFVQGFYFDVGRLMVRIKRKSIEMALGGGTSYIPNYTPIAVVDSE